MNYSIDKLPDTSRVWIYQSDRELSNHEVAFIGNETDSFIAEWTTHGKSMRAGFAVVDNRFLVIAADESMTSASGCGIDKSVNHVKRMGTELGVDFFNRMLSSYRQGVEIITVPVHEFWARRKAGVVTADTLVFNNLAQNLGEFRMKWLIPFRESWHEEMWKS